MASSEPLNLIASIVDSTGNAVPVLRAIRATGSRVFSIVADASMPMSLPGTGTAHWDWTELRHA